MDFFRDHLLSIVTYTPLVGALILLLPGFDRRPQAVRWIANLVAFIGFLVSLPLWFWFDKTRDGFQFVERASWIPGIGVQYLFGVDGVTVLLILLTTLLGFIAILSSWSAIHDRVRPYYVFLLLLQTGMIGVFCSLDMFLFYVFWEVMLVPMYFLIGIWGGERRLYAAIKFFLYTLVGSVVMLLGILALYFRSKGMPGFEATGTFDVTVWYQMANGLPLEFQKWVFLAFFLGFAVKVPMFPFHTWLPDAHVQAPTAGSVILAGVLLKMGTYGFLRFSLPMLPQATLWAVPWMAALAIIGIVYAALVTLVQKDMKKLIAYSSVSHLGFVMLGMFALNPLGLEGSVLQMINHGLSTGGLFLLVGVLYERRHTKEISAFGGIAHVMPVYATVTLIIFLASMGLPLLNGFIGEAMILLGAYAANKAWAYWAVSGIVLGAAYLLWLYQRVFWGPVTHEENKTLPDLNARELATLVPLVVLCFWIGVYPKPFLAFLHRPMGQLAAAIQPAKFPGAGGGAVLAAEPGTFPERSETVVVRPSPGADVAPAAPPERSETVVVRPSPSPQ
jgi:NADH-quinone oxidoreductase subunit M